MVSGHCPVSRQKRYLLTLRLREQHPIEGITVMRRQDGVSPAMVQTYRQKVKALGNLQ